MIQYFPAVAATMERWIKRLCLTAAWFNIILLLTILLQVALRHFVSGGHQVILGELEWHLYAVAIMFGLSYSQVLNKHVRVDVVSKHFSQRKRAWVEILGILFLMMPFIIIMFLQGLDYVAGAWRVNERSDSPVGLPWRWLIKSVIPASLAVLFFALLARLLREIAFLAGVGAAVGAAAEENGGSDGH